MTTTLIEPTTSTASAEPGPTARIDLRRTVENTATMAHRGLLKIKHNPEQLFDVMIQPVIFTLLFTFIFGGAVSGDIESYLPVIIPGILVQTVVMTSAVTGVQLKEDMQKGVFDRFKSLPIARISALSGALTADMVRYGIASVLTVVVGLILGFRPNAVGTVAAVLLVVICSFATSWIWAFFGVIANKASAVQGYSMMVLFPLTFASTAFVPKETMPGWLQAFVDINPVSHLVWACRELMNDGHVGIHVFWSLVGAAVLVGIFAPLTVRAYMRRA